jgi:hypothetical protein
MFEANELIPETKISAQTNTFFLIFFGVPHLATFIFIIFICVYVIASIAYIHPVYSARVGTHDLLIVSHLP